MIRELMTMELKKMTTKKKRLEKFIENLLYKDLMERNIPTLPSLLVDSWLDKKNHTTWALQMVVVLESYNLAFMVLQDFFPHPMVWIEDTLDDEEFSIEWSNNKLQ